MLGESEGVAALKHRLIELLALKEAKEGRRYLQTDIAKETGLTENTVSRWMNKTDLQRVDDKVLIALCDFLRCDVADLLFIDKSSDSAS